MLILTGDMKAKVGSDNTDRERKMKKHELRKMNKNGKMKADLYFANSLVIENMIFLHWRCYKATWVPFEIQAENQIDHVRVRQCHRS